MKPSGSGAAYGGVMIPGTKRPSETLKRAMVRPLVAFLLLLVAALSGAQIGGGPDHVKWTVQGVTPEAVTVGAAIDPGWHLYSSVPSQAENRPFETGFTLGETPVKGVTESKPERAMDNNFGTEVAYFEREATFTLPIKGFDPKTAKLAANFQLCNDRVCLPPKTVAITASAVVATPPATEEPRAGDVTGQVAQAKGQGLLAYMGVAFGAGLLALLTPCVFPMIPITVSYFSKQKGEGARRGRGPVAQAVAYCLGIIGTYTVFGVGVTLLFGASSVQNFGTNPWVNLALGLLFVYLALNLFGAIQISLPSGFVNRFSPEGKGGLVAPALMGFTFTLTSFTCAVGFVGVVLGAAASGSVLFPVLGMLAFSTAFALPFFLLALFPRS